MEHALRAIDLSPGRTMALELPQNTKHAFALVCFMLVVSDGFGNCQKPPNRTLNIFKPIRAQTYFTKHQNIVSGQIK